MEPGLVAFRLAAPYSSVVLVCLTEEHLMSTEPCSKAGCHCRLEVLLLAFASSGCTGAAPFPVPDPEFLEPIVENVTNPGARVALQIAQRGVPVGAGWIVEMQYQWRVPAQATRVTSAATNNRGVATFAIPAEAQSKYIGFAFYLQAKPNGLPVFPLCAFNDIPTVNQSPEYVLERRADLLFTVGLTNSSVSWSAIVEPRNDLSTFCSVPDTPSPPTACPTTWASRDGTVRLRPPRWNLTEVHVDTERGHYLWLPPELEEDLNLLSFGLIITGSSPYDNADEAANDRLARLRGDNPGVTVHLNRDTFLPSGQKSRLLELSWFNARSESMQRSRELFVTARDKLYQIFAEGRVDQFDDYRAEILDAFTCIIIDYRQRAPTERG